MESHHAVVYFGDIAPSAPALGEFHTISVEQFGIDDARALQRRAYQSPADNDGVIFRVSAKRFTVEAQNALLKLFEEPPAGVTFELVVPREDVLIPTLRSRLERRVGEVLQTTEAVLQPFLALSVGERLECIAEKTKAKDTEWSQALLNELEQYATGQPNLQRALVMVREYDTKRGSSQKMLLEHVALMLPA